MKKNNPLLRTKGLHKVFSNGTAALRGIDLELYAGDFMVLAGPNGSGKSVLMKHLSGLLNPTQGSIERSGSMKTDLHSSVGLVFQDADSQIVAQTVYDDTAFGPENLRLSSSETALRVEECLKALSLWEKKDERPHLLSGGEKRRLAIAGVLAMDPEIMILDEPFSNLDYPGVRSVLQSLLELHQRGKTLVIITHDVEKCLAHANRLVILLKGTLAADDRPVNLVDRLEEWDIRRPRTRCLEEMTWLN